MGLALTFTALSALAVSGCGKSGAGKGTEKVVSTDGSVYDFSLKTIDGEAQSLSTYKGKVLLIVNTASKCGFTPQYEGLQKLHEKYADDGLVVMGIPSNDFMGQEPGTETEIKAFCESKFHVTFPMYSKVKVKGDGQDPLYTWLTSHGESVSWNFNKFLVGRDGKTIQHFGSRVEPEAMELTGAITGALASSG